MVADMVGTPPPGLWACLRGDLQIAVDHNANVLGEAQVSLRRKLNVCLSPGLLVCFLHRIAHALWTHRLQLFARGVAGINALVHHVDLHPACRIGPGLYIPHPAGVSMRCHAARNCVVLASACLDSEHPDPEHWPQLGQDVWVASCALVLGDLSVGDHTRIGPGTVVRQSVGSGMKVLARGVVIEMYGDLKRGN